MPDRRSLSVIENIILPSGELFGTLLASSNNISSIDVSDSEYYEGEYDDEGVSISSMTVTYFNGADGLASSGSRTKTWNSSSVDYLDLELGDIVTGIDLVLTQPVKFRDPTTGTGEDKSNMIYLDKDCTKPYGTFTISADQTTGKTNRIHITPIGKKESWDSEGSAYYFAHSYAGTSGQVVANSSDGGGVLFVTEDGLLQIAGDSGESLLVGTLSFGQNDNSGTPYVGISPVTAPEVEDVIITTDKTSTKTYGTIANKGVYIEPKLYTKIEDRNGEKADIPIFASYWKYCGERFSGEGFYLMDLYVAEEDKIMFGSSRWIKDPNTIKNMMARVPNV